MAKQTILKVTRAELIKRGMVMLDSYPNRIAVRNELHRLKGLGWPIEPIKRGRSLIGYKLIGKKDQLFTPARKESNHVKKLEKLINVFKKGQVVGVDDLISIGFTSSTKANVIKALRQDYELDLLTIARGGKLIGWVLSDEVL